MANYAYLINTQEMIASRETIREKGIAHKVVSEAAYRIPVPWLLCFTAADLVDAYCSLFDQTTDEKSILKFRAPITTREQAKKNLLTCEMIFPALCDDEDIGRAYWQHAVDALDNLTYRYLTIDPVEIFYCTMSRRSKSNLRLVFRESKNRCKIFSS